MLSNYTYSKYAINKGYNDDVKLFSPYYFELISNPREEEVGYWVFKFDDFKVELNSFYFNFSDGGPIPPIPVNYWKEVDADDKPFNEADNRWYFIIWKADKWIATKYKNNRYEPSVGWIIEDLQGGKYRLMMRPNATFGAFSDGKWRQWDRNDGSYFKAVYRWNDNSEPNKPFISPQTGEITDWNLKQQSKVNNNKDNEIKVNVKNKDISENPIYELEANYFNWLSITNELETNNIPSLIPTEIKLSDGEYGKYLTNLIVYNDKIEDYLSYFSQWYTLLYSKAVWMSIIKNLVLDNIKIIFDRKLFNLNQIEISGIWGYGNYDINIFIEKPNEKIIEGKDINLELIKSTSIGTKVSGKDRNTYLQLVEFDVWYLYKNGI